LFLNDLHEYLGGGIEIDGANIRLLMYADDIVLLSDDVTTMQKMIDKLEAYCSEWLLEVNISKSEMMVCRRGGRLAAKEKWEFKGEQVRIVQQYKYLGVILTPTMIFATHVRHKNDSAKTCISVTWNNFMTKEVVTLQSKMKLFEATCRAVQTYGAQVWGYSYFEEVDKLQRYFLKKILPLPDCTPTL